MERHKDKPSLSLNERIVWISDNGPEYGNVRWLGKLPDLGTEWMAGVEFDNPVGSGTGLYRDRQLFVTPLNHASLVPIIGLLKASDYDEPPRPPARSSSIRLIDLNEEHDETQYNPDYILARRSPRHDANEDFYRNLMNSTEPQSQQVPSHPISRWNKAPVDPFKQLSSSSSRIRNIPIAVEGRDSPISMVNHQNQSYNHHQPPNQSSNADTSSSSPSRQYSRTNPKQSSIDLDELASNISRTAITNKRQSPIAQAGLARLPPPALVVSGSERNPNLAMRNMLGKSRGIQGHNNSCYLDATLFSMFATTTLFDSLLYRPANGDDIPEYEEIQRILRENIVRPLRSEYIVNADQVMMFRTMLERSSSVQGLTDEEKDPEEFLSLLLGQILKAKPYLKLSSGLESLFYQLIVDKDENMVLPTVQDLLEQSFMDSTVRLREIPPCLLLQMPRFGRQYKMYSRIMPSLQLDVTDILEGVPRACGHRGKDCDNIARCECRECFSDRPGRNNAKLSSVTYCNSCFKAKHFGKSHSTGIEGHDKTKTILDKIPQDALFRYSNKLSGKKDRGIPRVYMDLFAVLCIETSHYVCFVKCGQDQDAPWCFFDSMADRRGEQNGYNIPEVLLFDEFQFWTSDRGATYLFNHKDDKLLPEMARRLICDAYLCFYQYRNESTNAR